MLSGGRSRDGNNDFECRAGALGAFHYDPPIVSIDDTLTDRQPQSRAVP
jgi:hypothetical protein